MSLSGARRWKPILIAAFAACAVAGLGALMTDLRPWYAGLRKPAWQPPDWLFGPAWTLIFGLCALAGYLAWRERSRPRRTGMGHCPVRPQRLSERNVERAVLPSRAPGLGARRGRTALAFDRDADRGPRALLQERERASRSLPGVGRIRRGAEPRHRSAQRPVCLTRFLLREPSVLSDLFSTGHIVDAILGLVLLEALVLLIYARRTGRGIAPLALLPNLAAGAMPAPCTAQRPGRCAVVMDSRVADGGVARTSCGSRASGGGTDPSEIVLQRIRDFAPRLACRRRLVREACKLSRDDATACKVACATG